MMTEPQHAIEGIQARCIACLPPNAVKLFTLYVQDAGNWGGRPLVNGNVTLLGEREDRGLLTHLKRAGLITTFHDEHKVNGRTIKTTWIQFTGPGKSYADSLGLSVNEL